MSMEFKETKPVEKEIINKLKSESMDPEEVVSILQTNIEKGLTSEKVILRKTIFGLNRLEARPKDTIWAQIIEQLTDPMVKLLLYAAVISFVISLLSESRQNDDLPSWLEPLVIVLIIVFNTLVGIYQDFKAEKSVESLKKLQSKKSLALRNGEWHEIDSSFLVPGDILKIRTGDVVPADCRVLKIMSSDFQVDESIITGEAFPVTKVVEVQKEVKNTLSNKNIILSATMVVFGYCLSVVVQTGNATVFGNIMAQLEDADEDTKDAQSPLKKQLNEFGDSLARIIGVICLGIWILNFPKFFDKVHGNFVLGALYYFKQAVALGVAAIPEGLPAVITTCLSLGTSRMVKKNALVVKLAKVETLGCTTVICSDKTGTLTMNKMFASKMLTIGKDNSAKISIANGQGYDFNGEVFWDSSIDMKSKTNTLFGASCLINNESKIIAQNGYYTCVGLPTEGALLCLGKKISKLVPVSENDYTNLFTFSFSSLRKKMSVLARHKKESKNYLFTKGSPSDILKICKNYENSSGEQIPIDEKFNKMIDEQIKEWARQGLRILALGYKNHDDLGILKDLSSGEDIMNPAYRYLKDTQNYLEIENDLTFLGLVGISDPVRPEAKGAIEVANKAGIAVFMITGDISETAISIAKDLKMIANDFEINSESNRQLKSKTLITPADFDMLSDGQITKLFADAIEQKRSLIFARASPQFKRSIVKKLTSMDHIVAMTGDGVNDAPALKQASIGIAMGISGTEVARESSDLILLDDNFSTIVSAIEEGRSIYANMKAFIRYMISSNIGEVVSIFLQSILGIPEGFNSIQLLWVNLVTDGLPATALSFNPVDGDLMSKPPRKSTDKIVDDWIMKRYAIIGAYVGIATVGIFIYYYLYYVTPNTTHTLITFSQLRNWTKCSEWKNVNFVGFESNPCDYFISGKKKASTLSLTVLTIIEMFNAINALSENMSIRDIGFFSNMYLLQAICLSIILHCVILYIPFFNTLFSVVPLDFYDWALVVVFSLPVIAIEEVLKKISRERKEEQKIKAD